MSYFKEERPIGPEAKGRLADILSEMLKKSPLPTIGAVKDMAARIGCTPRVIYFLRNTGKPTRETLNGERLLAHQF